nr:MAG TPA: hypothetical protein [Bacteriophage sp.]
MLSIIENIKKIEEENVKEVISLTNENLELKRRLKAFEKDMKDVDKAIKASYEKGRFDAIAEAVAEVKTVIDRLHHQYEQDNVH